MTIKKLLLTIFLLLGSLQAENSIGLNINADDVEASASIDFNALKDYSSGTSYLLDFQYLRTDGDNMTGIGFSGQNTFQGIEGLTLAFGLKSIFANNFFALPLTAKGVYTLPLIDSIPTTSLAVSFAYAPSVLTFRDGDNYSDLRVEADMEVIPNIHILAGYRNITTNYEYIPKTFNNGFYGGIKISF